MRRRRDLGLKQDPSDRIAVRMGELFDQQGHAVQSPAVAEERQHQAFLFDDVLREPGALGRVPEAVPGALTGALQIYHRDIAGGRGRSLNIMFEHEAHFGAPKRAFRLASPVFSSVDTMIRMTMSGCPSGRYCTCHSTEQPASFGLTPKVPM